MSANFTYRFLLVLLLSTLTTNLFAQQSKTELANDKLTKLREIFVPYDDLEVLLEGDLQRVFLTQQQYQNLLRRAARSVRGVRHCCASFRQLKFRQRSR